MTKKDYITIAAAFWQANSDLGVMHGEDRDLGVQIVRSLAEATATAMAADNSRFDRAKFLRACGV